MNDLIFLKEVLDFVEKTPELTGINRCREKINYPIPFFGNIKSAEVLTLGVNPSCGEFTTHRRSHWQAHMTLSSLHERLNNYFTGGCPPYDWFKGWTEALGGLAPERSYANGAIAHTDLSPRPTLPMSTVPDKELFRKMIKNDIKFLFEILVQNKNIRLIMTGGQVLGEWYIAQWVRDLIPSPLSLKPMGKGTGATSFYKFDGLGRDIWLFSSGVGPTFREPLLKHVSLNRDALLDILR